MKKILLASLIANVVLVVLLVSICNTKVSWYYNGQLWSYKLGGFFLDRFRGE